MKVANRDIQVAIGVEIGQGQSHVIAIAEFENPHLDLYGAEFFQRASAARARKPRFVQMRKHNHTSMIAHFNSGEDYLGREILAFFDGIPS